jgi:hypothetical protein
MTADTISTYTLDGIFPFSGCYMFIVRNVNTSLTRGTESSALALMIGE